MGLKKALAALGLATVAAGCGGGGGGGSAPAPSPAAQTPPSFTNAPPNTAFPVAADARTGLIGRGVGGAMTFDVAAEPGVAATVGFDGQRRWSRLTVESTRAPLDADAAAGDGFERMADRVRITADGGSGLFRTAVPSQGGLTPRMERLEHMTFGTWATAEGPGLSPVGVGAFGWATDPAALRGVAAYDGAIAGLFVDSAARRFATEGRLTADVNFDTGRVAAVTRDTRKTGAGLDQLDPRLDFFMNGSIAGGVMSGAAVSTSGTMTGDFSGRAFGPRGEEIGGTFELEGDRGRHAGAFGARAR